MIKKLDIKKCDDLTRIVSKINEIIDEVNCLESITSRVGKTDDVAIKGTKIR